MAFTSTPRTAGGTTLSISAALPASITQTAYAALSWTVVGEVTSVPEYGKVWQTVAHQALAKKYPDHFKATYDNPAMQIPAAYAPGDAGQVIVKAAVESTNAYSIKIAYPDGETEYMQALVLGAPTTPGASGDIVGANIQIQPLNATNKTVAPA